MNIETLGRAQSIAIDVLTGVEPAQMEHSTPCHGWNVSQLIDHMVGTQRWATCGIRGEEMSDMGEGSASGDFVKTYADAAQESREAFGEEGALDRTVNPGFGDMPGSALLGMAITDTFVHAWDLAIGTGQESDLDPELAEQLLAAAKKSIQPEFRGPEGAPFGQEQRAPEGSTNAAHLAAFLGRAV